MGEWRKNNILRSFTMYTLQLTLFRYYLNGKGLYESNAWETRHAHKNFGRKM
jgi:hypothetical protein